MWTIRAGARRASGDWANSSSARRYISTGMGARCTPCTRAWTSGGTTDAVASLDPDGRPGARGTRGALSSASKRRRAALKVALGALALLPAAVVTVRFFNDD